METNDRLLSRKEAAEFLGLREQTLAVWLCNQSHSLPCYKIGRLAKYRRGDLERFVARCMVNAPAAAE